MDVDGDDIDEVLVSLEDGAPGWVHVLEDWVEGLVPMSGLFGPDGWIQIDPGADATRLGR